MGSGPSRRRHRNPLHDVQTPGAAGAPGIREAGEEAPAAGSPGGGVPWGLDTTLHEPHVRDVVESRALLTEGGFGTLWLAQGLAQAARNALLFSLLVVVLNITGSSVHTSLLIFTF